MVLIKFLLETFFKLFLKRPIWTSTVRVSISVLLSQTRSKSCLREKTCRGADIKKGVVRQSLTRIKVPRSHKPMMHKFGTTP